MKSLGSEVFSLSSDVREDMDLLGREAASEPNCSQILISEKT